ncbi:hypothetical protein HDU76_003392 [Blyttiomyces sp. JEL0837]|nr:hypothetical protein HDU76_003392 [Blyttiomyces sp. JEL0837]
MCPQCGHDFISKDQTFLDDEQWQRRKQLSQAIRPKWLYSKQQERHPHQQQPSTSNVNQDGPSVPALTSNASASLDSVNVHSNHPGNQAVISSQRNYVQTSNNGLWPPLPLLQPGSSIGFNNLNASNHNGFNYHQLPAASQQFLAVASTLGGITRDNNVNTLHQGLYTQPPADNRNAAHYRYQNLTASQHHLSTIASTSSGLTGINNVNRSNFNGFGYQYQLPTASQQFSAMASSSTSGGITRQNNVNILHQDLFTQSSQDNLNGVHYYLQNSAASHQQRSNIASTSGGLTGDNYANNSNQVFVAQPTQEGTVDNGEVDLLALLSRLDPAVVAAVLRGDIIPMVGADQGLGFSRLQTVTGAPQNNRGDGDPNDFDPTYRHQG